MNEHDAHDEVHMAGWAVRVDEHLRQRCGWCGAMILEMNTSALYPVFGPGDFVQRNADGGWTRVGYAQGDPMPVSCCMVLDPEVTR